MRILVVDDEAHSRDGLRDWLAREGHRVETASDGLRPIPKIKHGRFDVVLVDADLGPSSAVPLTGWDFARIFHLYDPGLDIVLMAVDDSRVHHRSAGDPGRTRILEKPISPARLKTLLGEMRLSAASPSSGAAAWRASPPSEPAGGTGDDGAPAPRAGRGLSVISRLGLGVLAGWRDGSVAPSPRGNR